MLLAQVPQTARVNKNELKAPEVAYQGDPKFEPIEKTTVARAVNTDKDIFKVGDLYYMCFQGVWFMAQERRRARGKWPSSVPEAIYEIPVSSPVAQRHLRHRGRGRRRRLGGVRGGGRLHRPDGRLGLRGVGHRLLLPAVLRATAATTRTTTRTTRPTGTAPGTTRGPAPTAAAPSPTVRTAARAWPRATTRAPAPTRAARRPGVRTARAASAQAYNPRTGTYAQTRQGSNVYGSWGSTAVQRGDDWATHLARHQQPRRATRRASTQGSGGGESITRTARTAAPSPAPAAATSTPATTATSTASEGDSWQKYDNGSWGNVDRPTPTGDRAGTTDRATTRDGGATVGQLDHDRAARTDGATRTRDAGTYRAGGGATTRSGGSSGYGGSYRPSGGARAGGGMRGGGGRRR